MRFDVTLSAAQPVVVRNTVMSGSVRPDLHLGGTGLVPVLTGQVYLDPTTLKLPASTLSLTGGTVRFETDDPFLPRVDVQGRTRMLGYDINAALSGPYDEPEVRLSSTPPLAQEDLLLLLFTGRLPDDPAQSDALAAANTVALYLAKDTLARWLAGDGPTDEDSFVSRFDLEAGRDVSKNGVETLEVSYRLTDKEGLASELRDRRNVYLVGERDRFEDYNYGLRLVFRFAR
ncbi:MAG: translocation/assembly module TamB domain-containing protein [Planctomycetes bacterium]|nr:translocation/assembly module TamB domain-containing protein [Planctomycetota bacterium]